MPEFGNAFGIRDFERQGRTDVCGYVHDGDPHLFGINRSVPALFQFGIGQRAFEICGPIPELFASGLGRQNDHGEKFRVMGERRRD
ncbi:hypothetical protein ACFYE9_02045 [Rhizobium leguminosarum]|nr:hypothetical protein [Rhizobium leguminosarum]